MNVFFQNKHSAHKKFCFLFFVLFFLISCSSAKKQTEISKDGEYGPPSPAEAELQGNPSDYGPVLEHVKKLAVILGPGLARNYATIGFFRALEEENIQVSVVIGSESGALMTALFGKASNVNEYEWDLLRLKEESWVLSEGNSFSLSRVFKRADKEGAYDEAFGKVFGVSKIENSKTPIKLCSVPREGGSPTWIEDGPVVDALKHILLEQAKDENGRSCEKLAPFSVRFAKEAGFSPIVVFDVASPKLKTPTEKDAAYRARMMSGKLRDELLAQADLVIRPEMEDVGYFDFSKKSTAAYAGMKATKEAMSRIKALLAPPGEAEK